MKTAYNSRYVCDNCGKYHSNGSKAQEKCELEMEVKRLRKFETFVKHIYEHSDKSKELENWVMCKICKRSFREIINGNK